MRKRKTDERGRDWVKILGAITALGALALGIFNAVWQYQLYQERLHETDVIISNVQSIELRGTTFDWKTSFNTTLKIVTPHYLRISISKEGGSFYIDNEVSYMLIDEYPTYVNISENVEEHIEPGVKTLQLEIPVEAKFLLGGVYWATYSSLVIGKLHFVILVTDLQTNSNSTLEAYASVRWN